MKKIYMLTVMLVLFAVPALGQVFATNGLVHDIKLVVDREVILADSGATTFLNTAKFAFDADSVAFIVSTMGDSATKRTSPFQNLFVEGRIEWLDPVLNKSVKNWDDYMTYGTKAATADSVSIYFKAVPRITAQLYGAGHFKFVNHDATRKQIRVKIWVIKFWRRT